MVYFHFVKRLVTTHPRFIIGFLSFACMFTSSERVGEALHVHELVGLDW